MYRSMGYLLTIIYTVGGMLTGYNAYVLRMAHEAGAGLEYSTLLEIVTTKPLVAAGPLLLLLGILLHRSQINKAQDKITELSLAAHRSYAANNQLTEKMKEQEQVFKWVKDAINESVARQGGLGIEESTQKETKDA